MLPVSKQWNIIIWCEVFSCTVFGLPPRLAFMAIQKLLKKSDVEIFFSVEQNIRSIHVKTDEITIAAISNEIHICFDNGLKNVDQDVALFSIAFMKTSTLVLLMAGNRSKAEALGMVWYMLQ